MGKNIRASTIARKKTGSNTEANAKVSQERQFQKTDYGHLKFPPQFNKKFYPLASFKRSYPIKISYLYA